MNVKRASEVRTIQADFSGKLIGAERLTGTPTVVEMYTSDLTISSIELTAAPVINWWGMSYQSTLGLPPFIPTSKGVQFRVSGGLAGRDYTLRVTCGTDATYPQTLIVDTTLRVN